MSFFHDLHILFFLCIHKRRLFDSQVWTINIQAHNFPTGRAGTPRNSPVRSRRRDVTDRAGEHKIVGQRYWSSYSGNLYTSAA